ncbi:MAG: N-acetyl-gamma-glutamyl-phosphate reductase [Candidatus Omnitrophica bacterium]|nr:N-acetyl-gamma-glutamyl-phosphate reductase [Candidatus Omnitrophota bacterium]
MNKCAVIGATGYTGIELVKILIQHPSVEIVGLTTRQKQSIPVRDLIPALGPSCDLMIETYSFEAIKRKADVVFLCLPHTEAMETAEKFLKAGKIVIDLSADFRLKKVKDYEKWYKVRHSAPHLLKKAVYGAPEFFRKDIGQADLIANPGCYPTAAYLAVVPLLQRGLVESEDIIIDAKSGVTGAGKKLNPATQFCEVHENFYAYKVAQHQHTPEIEQILSDCAQKAAKVTFVTHLLPVRRGILATVYMKKKKNIRLQEISKAFREAYRGEPFVRVKPEGVFPSLKDVERTNFCDLGFTVEEKTGRVIVVSAIDNLLKGASGQAVQNMNIRLGFPETKGICSL